MTLICIEKSENGSHKNRTLPGKNPKNYPIPEGYALIPDEAGTPDTLENFPFGDITVEDRDGIPTVTSWTPLPVPEPEPTERDTGPDMTAVYAAATAFVAVATTLTDTQALAVQSLAKTWDQALAEGTRLEHNTILRKDGRLYRVAQSGGVTPQEHQPPDAEGMLAVYRPIDKAHTGTLEDPIPWVYGMDCYAGQCYSYNGTVYRVSDGGDMIPCVWPPDTPGLWQWEAVQNVAPGA